MTERHKRKRRTQDGPELYRCGYTWTQYGRQSPRAVPVGAAAPKTGTGNVKRVRAMSEPIACIYALTDPDSGGEIPWLDAKHA